MFPGFHFVAAARVNSSVGAASFRWQTGGFSTVTNAVAGTTVLTLLADYGVDATEMFPILQPDSALAASDMTTFGIVSTSDTVKTCSTWQEGAAGGASALTDVDFWIGIWKRPSR